MRQELLEKPTSKEDNIRMLLDLNGGVCEVVTGVALGAKIMSNILLRVLISISVYPILSAPGYEIKCSVLSSECSSDQIYFVLYRSMDERTLVYFADNPLHVLKAYVDSQEGLDRAGGFAVQVCYSPELERMTMFMPMAGSRKLTHSQD